MFKIAHRGNLFGPNEDLENSPEAIFKAIEFGFMVEVDVWVKEEVLYFGHDKPQYPVHLQMLERVGLNGWFHCKNLEALLYFNLNHPTYHFFWHQNDDYTLTSSNYIWTFPDKPTNEKSILVYLEPPTPLLLKSNIAGICSDSFLVK